MTDQPSIFTRIMNGEIPAKFVYQDDLVIAIHDINPVAPVHILIIPREPLVNVYDINEQNAHLAGHMLLVAAKIAAQEGITNGFRVAINSGAEARQEVMHLHMHLIAGKELGRIG